MKSIKKALLMLISCFLVSGIMAQTTDQKLYRVYTNGSENYRNIEARGINVYNSSLNNYIDILATPDQVEKMRLEGGSRIDFLADNFRELVANQLKTGSFTDYHDHQDVMDLMNEYASSFPNITKLDTIGYSNLGREICCLKISDNPTEDEDETPILVAGCHHGNEVLSVEATLYQIDYLLNNYETDAEVSRWVNNMEIWYVPLVNPDGREDIRRTNNNGVDLNRNYDMEHTAVGNHGPYGFSEPETRAIRDLAAQYPPVMSLTYHTSGRLVLLPWTHTDDSAPDSLALSYVGNRIAESISFPSGSGTDHYELRQGGDWYFTAGEYCDYMYAKHNAYAYTVEMWTRQTPDASVIPEVIERNLEGMKTMLRQAERAGVSGRIIDKLTRQPVVAEIKFPIFDDQGKMAPHLTNEQYGRYHKYLVPGTYEMLITAPGYRTINREVTISEDNMFILDLEMDPAPDLQLKEFLLSDESGNGIEGNADGLVNVGETPGVFLTIYNDQQISAQGCYGKVTTNSPYVNLMTDSLYFGAIAHFSEVQSSDTLLFKLKANCPDGEKLDFHIDLGDEVSIAWMGDFSFESYTPEIKIEEVVIRDEDGNNNGILDNGESVKLGINLKNHGRQDITQVVLSVMSSDPYFTVQTESLEIQSINQDGSAFVEFMLSSSSNTPDVYSAYITLDIVSSEGYQEQIQVPVNNIFGFMDDFENGINGWTHASYGTTSNNHDDWMLGEPQGKAGDPETAFSTSNCWGTDLGFDSYNGESWNGEYQSNVHNYLESPSIDCSNMKNVGLRYQRWLNTRVSDIGSILVNGILVWKSSARGHSDQEWTEQLIDISEIADGNPDIRIRFELRSSNSNELGGWNIDDVLVANELASGSTVIESIATGDSNLLKCYPNPFSTSTTIEYKVDSYTQVKLWIADALGRNVKTLISEKQYPGNKTITWIGDGDSDQVLKPGIYNISILAGTEFQSVRVMIVR